MYFDYAFADESVESVRERFQVRCNSMFVYAHCTMVHSNG